MPFGYYNEFPHTTEYDQDLGQLIALYKQLVSEYSTLVSEINRLSDQLANIYPYINQTIYVIFEQYKKDITAILDKYKVMLDEDIAGLTKRVEDAEQYVSEIDKRTQAEIDAYQKVLKMWYDNINLRFDAHKAAIDAELVLIRNDYNGKIDNLQKQIDNISGIFPPVIDPTTGKQVNIDVALSAIYNRLRIDSFTCVQFANAWWITCDYFNESKITCDEFAVIGRRILQDYGWITHMTSPFTGKWERIPDVINQIVGRLSPNSITAIEYDDKAITAQVYDDKLITAVTYDFDAKTALP